jgi:hypothetical protein
MGPLSIPGIWMRTELQQKNSEQGYVEILSANLPTLNPTRNALKFRPLLLYEKAATNGTKYSTDIVTPATEVLHEVSKIMI